MASKLNATRNNPNQVEVKREPKQLQQQQSEDEKEIINEIYGSNQKKNKLF